MYKVFIVDDDPAIVNGLRQIIDWEEYGLDISGMAFNGLEAWRFIENYAPDILITDIKMPFMDGLELIRKVKQTNSPTRFVVLSGYDDFEYLKESIKLGIENYILKPVNLEEFTATLVNTLDKLQSSRAIQTGFGKDADIIRDNVLYRLVTGSISEDELNERLFLLDIKLDAAAYAVCILRVLVQQADETAFRGLMPRIARICDKTIKKYTLGMAFCSPDCDIIFLLNNDKKPIVLLLLRKVLEECLDAAKASFNLRMFITAGSFENNWRLLHRSYKKAVELQQYSLIWPPDSILDTEIEKNTVKIQGRQIFSFDEISKLIASKEVYQLLDYIDCVFDKISGIEGITPSFVQNAAVELLFHVINKASSITEGSHALIQELQHPVSDIFKLQSLNDIIKFTKDTAQSILQHLIQRHQNLHPIIKRAMEHIKTNYPSELSLKCLAYDFNVNANYLGRLFKEELGEFFTDYLNKVRVEKAKELLLLTNKSIREISLSVGYTDPNYFYRLFKKYTSISPAEFKNQ